MLFVRPRQGQRSIRHTSACDHKGASSAKQCARSILEHCYSVHAFSHAKVRLRPFYAFGRIGTGVRKVTVLHRAFQLFPIVISGFTVVCPHKLLAQEQQVTETVTVTTTDPATGAVTERETTREMIVSSGDYYANTRGRFPGQLRLFDPKIRVYYDAGSEEADTDGDMFVNGTASPAIEFASFFWGQSWGRCLGYSTTGLSREQQREVLPSLSDEQILDNLVELPRFGFGSEDKVTLSRELSADEFSRLRDPDNVRCVRKPRNEWRWGPSLGVGIGGPIASDASDGSSSGSPVVMFTGSILFEVPLADTANPTTWGFELGYARGYSTDETSSSSRDSAWFIGMTIKVPPK